MKKEGVNEEEGENENEGNIEKRGANKEEESHRMQTSVRMHSDIGRFVDLQIFETNKVRDMAQNCATAVRNAASRKSRLCISPGCRQYRPPKLMSCDVVWKFEMSEKVIPHKL